MPKLIRRPPIRYLGMNSTDPAIVVQQLFSDRQFPGVGGYTRQVDGHNGWQGGRRGVDETGPSHDMESESWGDHRASAIENPFRKLQALQEQQETRRPEGLQNQRGLLNLKTVGDGARDELSCTVNHGGD